MELLGTSAEKAAVSEIAAQLNADIAAMEREEKVSLLAKWLPSVNTSSADSRAKGRYLAKKLGYTEKGYRKVLSKLRRYSDILENRLRVCDYTFDYEKQPSCAMFKYRKAFLRNDEERYMEYLNRVSGGEAKINTATLYPYEIIRRCLERGISEEQTLSLDVVECSAEARLFCDIAALYFNKPWGVRECDKMICE